MTRSPSVASAAVALGALLLVGCSATPLDAAPPGIRLPAADARFDYQLGGAYPPPAGVSVVARDRLEKPAGLGYDICYVNGFQTQPGGAEEFLQAGLVLHVDGEPLADRDWPDEYLLDTSTAQSRTAIAAMVGPWIRGCATSGFDAVEIDNLDSYTRSEGQLTVQNNLALAAEFARLAHDAGLAIAQKNTADQADALANAGYDFAVTESCAQYDECGLYQQAYRVVLDIEYDDELGAEDFVLACAAPRHPSMILRDHDLVTPADPTYVYRDCR